MKSKEIFYKQMLLIRRFEERLFELFSAGLIFGTTHTYIGQEAIAVSVINNLLKQDIIVSSHRCHGHYLTKTSDVVGLLAEIMGKEGGICGGRGGSQHLHRENFYSNGVQGNMFPVAAGMAYAEKLKGNDSILVIFIGDGTFGQGTIYETLNLISLWKIPLLIVVENNKYAQTTPIKLNFAGSFVDRIKAFNISVGAIESNDVEDLFQRFGQIIEKVRSNKSPHVEIIHTYRLGPHSKGDDDRPKKEIEFWRKKDPLIILEKRLEKRVINIIEKQINGILVKAEEDVRKMAFPILKEKVLE
jgi:TPP-dependent pyruvate/acetoin dehydrogenase alpha subunit